MTDTLLGLPLLDAGLESSLATSLAKVEDGLRAAVASDDPFVADASRYLVEAGGKRFRPLLVLLAAQFGDPNAWGVVPSGVGSDGPIVGAAAVGFRGMGVDLGAGVDLGVGAA